MGQLRRKFQQELIDTLDQTSFTSYDFQVDYDHPDDVIVLIEFISDPAFSLEIRQLAQNLQVTTRPGRMLSEESYTAHSFAECLREVERWADNVLEELRSSNPLYEEIKSWRSEFEEHLKTHIEGEDVHFTGSEKSDLRRRLDTLEEKLAELGRQAELTEEEIEELRDSVETLKTNLASFKKKTWYRTAFNKFAQLVYRFFDSDQGRELMRSSVKGLLSGDASPE